MKAGFVLLNFYVIIIKTMSQLTLLFVQHFNFVFIIINIFYLYLVYKRFFKLNHNKIRHMKLAEIYLNVSHARTYNKVAIELYLFPNEREKSIKPRGKRYDG